MSNKKTSSKKSRGSQSKREERARRDARSQKKQDAKESDSHKSESSKMPSHVWIRETIESVVIAFILAFLFRTFEAEAFVIPTGSMAPTLMGRHKDVKCPECDYLYQVSASGEIEAGKQTGKVAAGTCPMCRYTMKMDPRSSYDERFNSFSGDRILVDKFLYQFADPERWDVAVFKCPYDSKTNFIKRLVGLPNESLKISHGDLFTRPKTAAGEQGGDFAIERKPPDKLQAILRPVFDNDLSTKIISRGWPPRWQPEPTPDRSSAGDWIESQDHRTFESTGEASDLRWLRYEHRVPDPWKKGDLEKVAPRDPLPQLIADSCAYNTHRLQSDSTSASDALGLHWVGDLAVCCTLDVESPSGEAVLELVEGGWRMQCRIDVATGVATLRIVDAEGVALKDFHPTAETAVRAGTKHKILFANVDDQLLLWVDRPEGHGLPRQLVQFDSSTTYSRADSAQPTLADLSPVGIGTEGARLRVSHLKVLRDNYYIADSIDNVDEKRLQDRGTIMDFSEKPGSGHLTDPHLWKTVFSDAEMREVVFELEDDQFLALGDNSARSQDGRLWRGEKYVSRELLTGKALFIYWPHSWDKVPGTRIPFPLFPNFAEMGFVR